MTKNPNFAQVAPINLGHGYKIEGLWHPQLDKFGSGASQLAKLFQFDQSQASRTLKRLLGKGFQFDQWKSEIHPDKVNVVLVETIADLIWELSILKIDKRNENLIPGQKTAIKIGKGLMSMGLVERYRDGFGFESDKNFRDSFLQEQVKRLEGEVIDLRNNDECWRYLNQELKQQLTDLCEGMAEPDKFWTENEYLHRLLRENGIDPYQPR
ncbi:MAG: hypothetical protein F6K56_06775 [Moorea sp. SIO3G5]|nr:hypothetical protein [Moorena sp. SIO3G5]